MVVDGLGVIEHAEVSFDRGSSALTGETGAGKTFLVAAISLLLGGRADRSMVRQGSDAATIQGRFLVPGAHQVTELLAARDLTDEIPNGREEFEIVVSRTVAASGPGKARINGRLVPASILSELGPLLVEIAGQHEHQRLASPARQRGLLDAYCGSETVGLAEEVGAVVREIHRCRRRLEELKENERERERELDLLNYEIAEIEGAVVEEGESERLTSEARRLEAAETLRAGTAVAAEALGGDGGGTDAVASARAALEPLADLEPKAADLVRRLGSVTAELDDVTRELAALDVSIDPEGLEEIRVRLDVLAKLRRKYGDDEGEVLRYLERSKTRAAELEGAGRDETELAKTIEAAQGKARELAESLTAARSEGARRLGAAVEGLLDELAMPGARFSVELQPLALYEGGNERVELLMSSSGADQARPLTKVASGGELSRVALALHLLVTGSSVPTMIFDEVDAGVGGAAARSVGRCLSELARNAGVQVLVVTHLPQVAAFADAQFRVSKSSDGGARASVEPVDGVDRVEELSRMLAGMPESERAQEHAQELLAIAASERSGSR